jgi:hypothetical protein
VGGPPLPNEDIADTTLTSSNVHITLFVWLISHQPAVLFSQNKPAITNQSAVHFSQNKPAPIISHQPNERAEGLEGTTLLEVA